jgi:hypothetical protein
MLCNVCEMLRWICQMLRSICAQTRRFADPLHHVDLTSPGALTVIFLQ